MAIKYSGIQVELREVSLRSMPTSMLRISPKGTVPVLVLSDGRVINESRDIILWALAFNDSERWLLGDNEGALGKVRSLIDENDASFKAYLDRYKYHEEYPEHSVTYYRDNGEVFLKKLEERLADSKFLFGDKISVADIAVFPFVRQFAHVDKSWFYQTPYIKLQAWLDSFLRSDLFNAVMHKYPLWKEGVQITML